MKKITVLLFLLGISFLTPLISNANTETPTKAVIIPAQNGSKSQATRKIVESFFIWLDSISQDPQKLSQKNLSTYFDPKVHYSVNGVLLANNTQELFHRFKKLLAYHNDIKVNLPLKQLVTADNKAAASYSITVSHTNNKKYTDDIVVILTLKKGKIESWNAVAAHKA